MYSHRNSALTSPSFVMSSILLLPYSRYLSYRLHHHLRLPSFSVIPLHSSFFYLSLARLSMETWRSACPVAKQTLVSSHGSTIVACVATSCASPAGNSSLNSYIQDPREYICFFSILLLSCSILAMHWKPLSSYLLVIFTVALALHITNILTFTLQSLSLPNSPPP